MKNWMDDQGWKRQLERATNLSLYPLVKKKRVYKYKLSKEVRLIKLVAKKVAAYDRLVQKPNHHWGRLKHLRKQICRLEYYIESHAL